jgi:hypothetical protein
MPAISINELRHAIPRYSNAVNEPNVNDRRRARHHDQPGVRFACEWDERSLDISGVARVDWRQLDAKQWRDRLDCGKLTMEAMIVGPRSTAARVVRGTICLSGSSHFALIPYQQRPDR